MKMVGQGQWGMCRAERGGTGESAAERGEAGTGESAAERGEAGTGESAAERGKAGTGESAGERGKAGTGESAGEEPLTHSPGPAEFDHPCVHPHQTVSSYDCLNFLLKTNLFGI